MTTRSTRNKIRWQAEKALQHLDKCQEHLRFLDDLTQGQSGYINETLPVMVVALDEYRKAMVRFRENL